MIAGGVALFIRPTRLACIVSVCVCVRVRVCVRVCVCLTDSALSTFNPENIVVIAHWCIHIYLLDNQLVHTLNVLAMFVGITFCNRASKYFGWNENISN